MGITEVDLQRPRQAALLHILLNMKNVVRRGCQYFLNKNLITAIIRKIGESCKVTVEFIGVRKNEK